MLKGIDISVWQGKIDWSEVAKDENVKFAILRAGYGMYTSQKDDRFEEYYAGCKRYNIPVGAYWFSYATTKQEINFLMEKYTLFSFSLSIMRP